MEFTGKGGGKPEDNDHDPDRDEALSKFIQAVAPNVGGEGEDMLKNLGEKISSYRREDNGEDRRRLREQISDIYNDLEESNNPKTKGVVTIINGLESDIR